MSATAPKVPRENKASNVVDLSDQTAQLPPSFGIARQVTQYVLQNGKLPDWFGPGQPIPPQAPPMLAARRYDYPTTSNINSQPRVGEGVSFAMLRRLADSLDLVRLAVETRKDQVCKLSWAVLPRDDKLKKDKRCFEAEAFFKSPDKEHNWDAWLRMILEDLLVLDAPAVYPRKTVGGALFSLEPIDGATIKRVIDDYGRTPMAPTPAYQQYIKGVPAFNFTRDELLYCPRNPRTNRLYGYSPVEQIIVTVNIALRRQAHQLQYYTDGSTPDLIMSVPADWTPKQIEEFQNFWNAQLAGQTDILRGTRFVQDGVQVIDTKDKVLMDKYDEWLARIVCFAFSMSPAPFVAQVNRATAESAATQAKEEGVEPIAQWVEDFMSRILADYMGMPDLCFKFREEEEVSPDIRSQIEDRRLKNGSSTIDEVRARNGEDPLPDGLGARPLIYGVATTIDRVFEPPAPPTGLDPGSGEPPNGAGGSPDEKKEQDDEEAQKLNKASQYATLKGAIAKALQKLVPEFVAAAKPFLVTATKADKANKQRARQAVSNANASALNGATKALTTATDKAHATAMSKALRNVGLPAGAPQFDLIDERGAAYAAKRAAQLIGTDASGGELGQATRDLIRSTIETALDEGWSVDELSDELSKSYAFSEARAGTIADTELRAALNQGELAGWKESGVVAGKQWLLSNDEGVCDICEGNADQGVVAIDDNFNSGDDAPPGHPNCRCSMAPVVSDEE